MSRTSIKAPIFAVSRLRMGTDGSGITTLVAFMGCTLKCKYCLNPKCHEPIYEEDGVTARKGIMVLTPQELYDLVKIDNIYFQTTGGGICFGGGEPTMYADFIKEFRQVCGDKWKITLETSVACSYRTIEMLAGVVDHWIVDIKSMDSVIYEKYTGHMSGVLQHLRSLQMLVPNEKVTIKLPMIPDFNEDRDLDADSEMIKQRFGFSDVVKITYKVIN